MKHAIRIAALTFAFAAVCVGAAHSKATTLAANIPGFSPPGPIPTCNPFIQNCPPIR